MDQEVIYLASASPRRRELLRQIGVPYRLQTAEIDESPAGGESAEQLVRRLAMAKGRTASAPLGECCTVLSADTMVVLGREVLGKPADRDEALAMIGRLSGRTHRVLTAVYIAGGAREKTVMAETKVRFRDISRAEREIYWQTGEPRDKAGGYAIQGIAAIFVERLEGSYSNVMGLPLFETARLLEQFGYRVLDNLRLASP